MKMLGKIEGTAKSALPSWVEKISAELKEGKDSVRCLPYPVFDGQQRRARFALVQCHYGHDERRLESAKKAIEIMAHSNPLPEEWVIVEAQDDGGYELKELAESSGAEWVGIETPENSPGIFLKEALWNYGALNFATSDSLVFIDIDCAMCNPAWAHHVEKCLDVYSFGSPHGFAYYACNDDGDEDETYRQVLPSSGYATMTGRGYGHPGFGVFMTRELFEHMNGIPCVSSAGGDSWLWYRVMGHWKRPYNIFRLPYNAPYIYNFGIRPVPKVGSTNELLCHIGHGRKQDRQYQAQALLARWSTTMPYEDLTRTLIPQWRDNASGRIHSKARAEFMASKDGLDTAQGIELARRVFDRVSAEEYGEIDDDHPLIVSTVLRSGDKYTQDHVLMLRDLFRRHLRTKHEFWCISDVEIKGVRRIPLETEELSTPYFYSQMELYRDIYPKGASVLTCDLDCIPIADFTMHRCPENTFWMGWEQHNWPKSDRCIWNGGLTYFCGKYDFIFNDFMSQNETEQMKSLFSFVSSQEFVQGSLFRHGVTIQDILRHICFEFYHGDGKLDVPCSTMVHFLGAEKPWSLKERPEWLPRIAWRPTERSYR